MIAARTRYGEMHGENERRNSGSDVYVYGERPGVRPARDHGGGPLSTAQVGTVDFETSCAPAVKDDFNNGVALLHSFWFPEAHQGVRGASLARDPACAMAHWGIALSHWGNPFGGIKQRRSRSS